MLKVLKHASRRMLFGIAVLLLPAASILSTATGAGAHETRGVAGHDVNTGWLTEPAFTGFPNAVFLKVTEQGSGEPVNGLQMKVEVLFGDRQATQKTPFMDLVPIFNQPGQYSAALVPTRPGTYTYHITGMLDGQPFDQYFTSGEGTFDSIRDPLEFPVQDPSRGQLNEKVTRLESRIEGEGTPAAASGGAGQPALWVGLVALAAALVALWQARKAKAKGPQARPEVAAPTDEG